MEIQLIRNATMRLNYAQHVFVTDPYLAAKFTRPSYTGKSPNPLVDLPCKPEEVLAGIEMAILSHLHSDHFDPAARELLPKNLPLICQPGDQASLAESGFQRIFPVEDTLDWDGIQIRRIPGQHGSGVVLGEMGQASGFILQARGEPTVYWAGDTILYESVEKTIAQVQPEVILTHSCGAVWGDKVLIVMDAVQTVAVCRAAPHSTVIAIHMEALDHATVTRAELRDYARKAGITDGQLRIPGDGEKLSFFQK